MTKANDLLKESLGEKFGKLENKNISPQDLAWGSVLGLQYSDGERQNNTWKDWQIRLAEDEFHMWLQKHVISSLFFDGATKGNSGIARAGGVIRNADGSIEHRYA